MEAVTTTDWHLDGLSRFFATPEAALAAQFEEIEKPFQYAIRRKIDNVIVAGDIGEHSVLSDEAKRLLLMTLLKYDGVLNTFIIPGNHDVNRQGVTSIDLFKLIADGCLKTTRVFMQPEQIDIDDIVVNMLPWPARERIPHKMPTLNVSHIELKNAVRDNGSRSESKIEIPKDGDHWLIGHLHTHQTGPNHTYIGTLFQKNFGEKGVKGWVHLRATYEGKKLVVSRQHIDGKPSLLLHDIKEAGPEELAAVTRDPRHLYKIQVRDGVAVPDALRTYPNVVYIGGALKAKEELTDEGAHVAFGDQDIHESIPFVLTGLTEAQVERAKFLIAGARKAIGA